MSLASLKSPHRRGKIRAVILETLQDLLLRQWNDLLSRPSGPMAFRFVLQPAMAIFLALRDGFEDARTGQAPYFWTILSDPRQRADRLREGLKATARVILLGIVMDTIYQYVVLKAFRPMEMAIVVLGLAFIPYLIARGPANRIAHWWHHRYSHPHVPAPKK